MVLRSRRRGEDQGRARILYDVTLNVQIAKWAIALAPIVVYWPQNVLVLQTGEVEARSRRFVWDGAFLWVLLCVCRT